MRGHSRRLGSRIPSRLHSWFNSLLCQLVTALSIRLSVMSCCATPLMASSVAHGLPVVVCAWACLWLSQRHARVLRKSVCTSALSRRSGAWVAGVSVGMVACSAATACPFGEYAPMDCVARMMRVAYQCPAALLHTCASGTWRSGHAPIFAKSPFMTWRERRAYGDHAHQPSKTCISS